MSFAIEPSVEVAYRSDFSLLCNARGYKRAVEVGTDQGVFARDFLSRWAGDLLFLVDSYRPYKEMPFSRDADLAVAVTALVPYYGRYKFFLGDSLAAAERLPKWLLPKFVYIDASHEYEDVANDLRAWWPILEEGGMLAGHDFDDSHPGVIRAVTEFAVANDLRVRLTSRDSLPSWYVYKGEPAELFIRFFDDRTVPNPVGRKSGR